MKANNQSILKVWRNQSMVKRAELLKIRKFLMGRPYRTNKFGDVHYVGQVRQ